MDKILLSQSAWSFGEYFLKCSLAGSLGSYRIAPGLHQNLSDWLPFRLSCGQFVFRWKGQWILLAARNQLSPRYFDILLLAFSYHNRHQRLAFSLSLGGD